jgi:two-component system response regulator AlgR
MTGKSSAAETIRVLIVDDEELARLRLRHLVADCADPPADVAGEAADASQALAWLKENECDLLLLDIQMPGADGTQLAAELHRRSMLYGSPAVVFVTAHPQHAVKAFELEAVDYLTKPVRRERLQAAFKRVAQRLVQRASEHTQEDEPSIVVNDRGRVLRVPVSQVLYLKAELKYVTLRTAEHTYVLDEALSDLEQRLGARFLRLHRNALVARKAVRALERRTMADEGDDDAGETWAVRVSPTNEWLAVSRRQVAAVREAVLAAGL